MKYHKVGQGRILNCWYDRIIEDFTGRDGDAVTCQCGAVIGTAEVRGIRMKQHAFTASGRATSK